MNLSPSYSSDSFIQHSEMITLLTKITFSYIAGKFREKLNLKYGIINWIIYGFPFHEGLFNHITWS